MILSKIEELKIRNDLIVIMVSKDPKRKKVTRILELIGKLREPEITQAEPGTEEITIEPIPEDEE